MNAITLNCHSCGAAVSSDAPTCGHCGARLATVACPACFSMMFRESRFCPACGSPAALWDANASDRNCPSCRVSMLHGTLRGVHLHECEKCFGLWLDAATFEQVCHSAEKQAAILGSAQPSPGGAAGPLVRYLPCPECQQLMHRMNFARCSGVVVDVCRPHGTWFDANELHRIVQFIQSGGMERSRAKEKAEWAEERRRIQAARMATKPAESHQRGSSVSSPDMLSEVLWAAGDLVTSWLRRR